MTKQEITKELKALNSNAVFNSKTPKAELEAMLKDAQAASSEKAKAPKPTPTRELIAKWSQEGLTRKEIVEKLEAEHERKTTVGYVSIVAKAMSLTIIDSREKARNIAKAAAEAKAKASKAAKAPAAAEA